MKKIIVLAILLSWIILSAQICANERIQVYGYSDYLPYMDGNKEDAKGLYSVLIKEIFKRADVDIKLEIYPWVRALYFAEKGKGGFGLLFKSKARLKIFDYSDEVFPERMYLYTLKGKDFKFDNIDDLRGKKIGIVRGYSYGESFNKAIKDKKVNVQSVRNDDLNFKKIMGGRIDCLISSELLASIYINKHHLEDRIVNLEKPVEDGKVYFVFAKQMNRRNILIKFNQAMVDMKKDGSFQKIIDKYISNQ